MGWIATGDTSRQIFLFLRKQGSTWAMDYGPPKGHTGSIEDLLQFPDELHLFASAYSDGTVEIYNTYDKAMGCQLSMSASHPVSEGTLSLCHQSRRLCSLGHLRS
ncbi:unnamed protein product [Tuber aestivum]|uniref:Uncharacterized protein n=1 Tax=Tuber aestivum TaxID=59557 RepID=A0A292PM81_9PEZI|nr:unnamed protein product [Tuber aestivum]